MKVNGYMCDGGCGASGVTKSHETAPEGWLSVYGDGGLHFCSWSCLRTYANDRGGLATT